MNEVKQRNTNNSSGIQRLIPLHFTLFPASLYSGFAHIIEHLAFRCTTHFQNNSIIKYMKSIGLAFGADVNAVTGTYLSISIPIPISSHAQTVSYNSIITILLLLSVRIRWYPIFPYCPHRGFQSPQERKVSNTSKRYVWVGSEFRFFSKWWSYQQIMVSSFPLLFISAHC